MIDFAANYNPLGPPDGIEAVVQERLPSILGEYGHPGALPLVEAVSSYVGVPAANVAHGAGSTEILFTLPRLLHHKEAVVLSPTFWEYTVANEAAGNAVQAVSLHKGSDFAFGPDELSDRLGENPAAVYLCNPNNPTSTMADRDEILQVVEDHPDSDFVVDETYLQFREDFDNQSLSGEATERENLHVVHSFSKFFAVPGIRSGALVSDTQTIERFSKLQIPYTANKLAHVVVPWLLGQAEYVGESRRQTTERRIATYALIKDAFDGRIDATEPQTNFIFARIVNPDTTQPSVTDFLSEKGIAVRGGHEFGEEFANYFRFCLRSPNDSDQLFSALTNYFEMLRA